jgi:hypothetical protein
MPAVELVGPVGPHEKDSAVAEVADEEDEEIASRGIGPVQVLEHKNHGSRSSETHEQRE